MNHYQLPDTISPAIFRAYDIRGIVDEGLTPNVVYALGLAIGSEAQARGQEKIVVGRDGRLSGPSLSAALIQGLIASGRQVIDIGVVPSPVLYFATHLLKTQSGVMLTGSHNPANYNGIKIVLQGSTLAENEIQKLYQRIIARDFHYATGTVEKLDILLDYIHRITSDIKLTRRLKVIIDCGNGVTSVVAPQLFTELGCEVIPLFCEIDGNFPNHHPDPSVVENLQDLIAVVKEQQADIGLAFDGDGDRLGMVTNKGEIIWPDRQMMLFARDVLTRNPGAEIIFDVKCTRYLSQVINAAGGKPIMYKTGHSLLKAKMQERKAPLAGEMSGHIFFKERWYGFDDGLYAGARLLEILSQNKHSISEIFKTLPDSINTPELKLFLPEEQKFAFMQQLIADAKFADAHINTIDGLRVDFNDGWGLVRPSNTSPCLTLRFEADSTSSMKRIQTAFRRQLLAIDNNLKLPF